MLVVFIFYKLFKNTEIILTLHEMNNYGNLPLLELCYFWQEL